MLIKITTGKLVSDHSLAPAHTQSARDGASARSARAFHEEEAAFQSLQRTTIENDDRGEEARFLV